MKHLQTNNVDKNVKIDAGKQASSVEAVSLFCVCGQQAFAQHHSGLCVITPQSHKWALSVALATARTRDMEMNIDISLSTAQVDFK